MKTIIKALKNNHNTIKTLIKPYENYFNIVLEYIMDYTKYYQKNYRLTHKDRIKSQQKRLYNLYKTEYIPCVYCNKHIQLNYCISHLNSKKCSIMQQSVNNYNELLNDYKKLINEIRSNLRTEST